MKDHGRKSNWTAQISPYLRGLKIKNLMSAPKSPSSPSSRSPRTRPEEDPNFQITHTPDRPERPVSMTAIPNDEECMEFIMTLQRQEENKRGCIKSGLRMWPYPEEEGTEDRRYLRSVRVESVHLEEAQLARTNSSGPVKIVDVGGSSTKSTWRLSYASMFSASDVGYISDDPGMALRMVPPSPPPTLPRSQSWWTQHTPRGNTSRWSDDSIDSVFSSREIESPCPPQGAVRSSAEASSPTIVGEEEAGPSTPPYFTPIKDRPATPFTDPRLRASADPVTPPPSHHLAGHVNIESTPQKYSWSSSRDTVLSTGAPVSRFPSRLPEVQPNDIGSQLPEVEVYGDWADYYFEEGNFWNDGRSDGYCDEDETRFDYEDGDTRARKEDDYDLEGEETWYEEERSLLGAGDDEIRPRYESFIKDYKKNVMNVTVTEL
ncbi:hypothetical protein CCHL11_03980 [Colletotrichum chlorophyti]|uniref:Uncharacterized protein n=1 Tax=Colletotrichum chlorophyti TaxID=708187 RepID=A0A1Q8RKT7_9PEZI|nr:hypothetical protein CCHL11_03980 [Colletotrichum chlorophyti]